MTNLEILLINGDINLMLTLSVNFAKCKADRIRNFAITDAKNYVFVETLLTQEKKSLLLKKTTATFLINQ